MVKWDLLVPQIFRTTSPSCIKSLSNECHIVGIFCWGITWLLEPSPSATWRSSTWRPPSCGAWKCRSFLRQLRTPRRPKILRPAPGGAWGDCGLTTGCIFLKAWFTNYQYKSGWLINILERSCVYISKNRCSIFQSQEPTFGFAWRRCKWSWWQISFKVQSYWSRHYIIAGHEGYRVNHLIKTVANKFWHKPEKNNNAFFQTATW